MTGFYCNFAEKKNRKRRHGEIFAIIFEQKYITGWKKLDCL